MSKKVTKVEPQVAAMQKFWTKCSNGHVHYYECGVVISPVPTVAECCGANVINAGTTNCGEG